MLDLVCHRLVNNSRPKLVVVAGDPFQAIYGFAGSRASLFMRWDVTNQRIMHKTWRNPAPVHELGERCLRNCDDYFDREIEPADHEGEVIIRERASDAARLVDPRESWLVIARTNHQAGQLGGMLNKNGTPWHPVKGNGGWKAPKQVAAALCLWSLHKGFPVAASEWAQLVDVIPATNNLQRGTKVDWKDPTRRPAKLSDLAKLDHGLEAWGALPDLEAKIRSEEAYKLLGDHGAKLWQSFGRWGELATIEPKVKVGTIHSVKGAEADHVLLLGASTQKAIDRGDIDEERRLAYVGVTRARRRLVVARCLSHRDSCFLPEIT